MLHIEPLVNELTEQLAHCPLPFARRAAKAMMSRPPWEETKASPQPTHNKVSPPKSSEY